MVPKKKTPKQKTTIKKKPTKVKSKSGKLPQSIFINEIITIGLVDFVSLAQKCSLCETANETTHLVVLSILRTQKPELKEKCIIAQRYELVGFDHDTNIHIKIIGEYA
jgi:hypothetical protein